MNVDRLVTNIAAVVTPSGTGAVRGRAMRDLDILPDAVIAISAGRIVSIAARSAWQGSALDEIDAGGCAIVPGLIDPHTHVVWGGDRLDDFDARTRGVAYETLLATGGGIRHTVACTAATAQDALIAQAQQRIERMMRAGATTIEVKSGYGLAWEVELRQLRAIHALSARVPAQLSATMLFHVPPRDDGERAAYLHEAANVWIPALADSGDATAIDVFIEREAFTVDEADVLMRAARMAGLGCKAHADQFHAIGGTELAISHGALSVDHLEASGAVQIEALAASTTVATILPGVTLHLGLPAAPARALIDTGAIVAVGTDCNPGSSPLFSMSLAMALAVRLNHLSPAEALTASTANAAAALGLHQVGRLAPDMCADFCILRSADWRDLPYTLGDDAVGRVFIAGHELH